MFNMHTTDKRASGGGVACLNAIYSDHTSVGLYLVYFFISLCLRPFLCGQKVLSAANFFLKLMFICDLLKLI